MSSRPKPNNVVPLLVQKRNSMASGRTLLNPANKHSGTYPSIKSAICAVHNCPLHHLFTAHPRPLSSYVLLAVDSLGVGVTAASNLKATDTREMMGLLCHEMA